MEVSAEVHFAQTLASNDKKIRDRSLKRLKKYLGVRSCHGEGISHDDFIKLWKGLHFCMWMQDKPLLQEELSQQMVSILHAFPKLHDAMRFVHAFFITEAREWTGIDRLRLDKFMMLIRELLRETFVLLSREGWPESECQAFSQNLTAHVMNEDTTRIPYGIKMHLADIFVVEMRKVSLDGMNAKKMTILMFPFIYFCLKTRRHEMAQRVYNQTVDRILQEFGQWSRQEQHHDQTEMNGDVESSDEEDMMEQEEEEDSNDDDVEEEEESEEEMSMDVDEKKTSGKRKKFDLSMLLRLMHRLAQDPKVEVRNRRFVYSIVNAFAPKDPTVLHSSQNEGLNDKQDLNITEVIQLTGETTKADSGNKKEKKRNRKSNEEEEEAGGGGDKMDSGSQEETVTSKTSNGPLENIGNKKKNNKRREHSQNDDGQMNRKQIVETTAIVTQKSKKRKRSLGGEEENEDTAVDMANDAKKAKVSGGVVKSETHLKTSSPGNASINCNANNSSSSSLPPPVGDEVQHSPLVATTPTASANSRETKNGKEYQNEKEQEEGRENCNGCCSDANTNARSSPSSSSKKKKKKPVVLFNSPVDCVVYKQKSPSRPSTFNELTKSMTSPRNATTQFMVSELSPSSRKMRNIVATTTSPIFTIDSPKTASMSADSGDDLHALVPERRKRNSAGSGGGIGGSGEMSKATADSSAVESSPSWIQNKSPPKSMKKTSSSSSSSSPMKKRVGHGGLLEEGEDDGTGSSPNGGVMDSLYSMISTPCSAIKKAVGIVAPPAPNTDPGVPRQKVVSTPEQFTPGTQKKVVFDLRRNKANKFRDYLKALSKVPSPAFEPDKSPGHSILKSPSVESMGSSDNSTPTTSRRKKGKGMNNKRKSINW